jgi:hypothetical protein
MPAPMPDRRQEVPSQPPAPAPAPPHTYRYSGPEPLEQALAPAEGWPQPQAGAAGGLVRPAPPGEGSAGAVYYPPPPPAAQVAAPGHPAAPGAAATAHGYAAPPRAGAPSPELRPEAGRRPGASEGGGQLIENIPRTMRDGVAVIVEVRLIVQDGETRGFAGPAEITRAMTVRLLAPARGFRIEPAAAETQWIEAAGQPGQPLARWRWTVTPERPGRGQLQLAVSARWVGPEGVSDEISAPPQVVAVAVRRNVGRGLARLAGWTALVALAGAAGYLAAGSGVVKSMAVFFGN